MSFRKGIIFCCLDGSVVACDVSDTHSELARRHWAEAGVADIIKLEIAPATETLGNLVAEGQGNTFDFAFIDADKVEERYFVTDN